MAKRNNAITLMRVIAMLSIVLCHIFTKLKYNTPAQFFNFGVQMFFLISGYLYGAKREIKNPGEWLFKRYLRIAIPTFLWLVIRCISALVGATSPLKVHQIVFVCLNLQGLPHIFTTMEKMFEGPWFFTNIMGCYILLLAYLKVESKHPGIKRIFSYGGVLPLAVFLLLAMLHVNTHGALTFFIGFWLKRRGLLDTMQKRGSFVATVTFVVAVALRLLGKFTIDETTVYNEIVLPGTQIIMAVAVLIGMHWLYNVLPKATDTVANSKTVKYLGRISIYVYVSHNLFFNGIICNVFTFSYPLPVTLLIFAVLALALATILCVVGEFLTKKIETAGEYLLA